MPDPTAEIVWAIALTTGVCSVVGILFLFSLVANQKRVLQAQAEKLDKAKQLEQVLREMSGKILDAQEQERKSVAADLHDGVLQILSGTRLMLETICLRPTESDEAWRKEVSVVAQKMNEVIRSVHEMAKRLRPSVLDQLGLIPAVRELCSQSMARSGIQVRVDEEAIPTLDIHEQVLVYRIVQEALNNVEKHSGATETKVEFRSGVGTFEFSITDNGNGMHPKGHSPRAYKHVGMGLEIMEERARMLGGRFQIRPGNGHGTVVRVEFSPRLRNPEVSLELPTSASGEPRQIA